MLNESLILIREAIEATIADKNRIQGLQNEITKAEETKRHNYLEVSRLVAEYLYGQGAKAVKEMERTWIYPHRHWLHQAIYQVCQGEGDLEHGNLVSMRT